MGGVILFIFAYILFLPLTIINYWYVSDKKRYFKSSALNIDKFANREFRTLWNKILITDNGYKFGNIEESISEVLGRNYLKGTLTKKGYKLVCLLTIKHCLDSLQK